MVVETGWAMVGFVYCAVWISILTVFLIIGLFRSAGDANLVLLGVGSLFFVFMCLFGYLIG